VVPDRRLVAGGLPSVSGAPVILGFVLTAFVGVSLSALAYSSPPVGLVAAAAALGLLLARMIYVAWCREQRRLDNVSRWGTPLEPPR
jgi:hypothetical protein